VSSLDLDYIADLQERFCHRNPESQRRISFSIENVVGSLELAARRGEQTGFLKTYELLRDVHPEAAEHILKVFHVNPEGELVL